VEISKTKIDRLGDRLRKGNITDDDLRLLDEYRRSFSEAYEVVVGTIRDRMGLEPTGRPAKSTTSIGEKLRRESIRLTQIQDIAGCRIVVPGLAEEEHVVPALTEVFVQNTVIDRRQKPSHGYRAVHVVVAIDRRNVEIQVRTALQQLWAELSEKFSDLLDSAIKYGGGNKDLQAGLLELSGMIAKFEEREHNVLETQRKLDGWLSGAALTADQHAAIIAEQEKTTLRGAKLRAAREGLLKAFPEEVEKFQKEVQRLQE
jgi:ppGpp synthetase/RelA/SpoT-type nucleotidyltranferase